MCDLELSLTLNHCSALCSGGSNYSSHLKQYHLDDMSIELNLEVLLHILHCNKSKNHQKSKILIWTQVGNLVSIKLGRSGTPCLKSQRRKWWEKECKYCKNASRKSCPVKSDRSGSLRLALPPEPSQFSGTVPQHNTGGQRTTLRNWETLQSVIHYNTILSSNARHWETRQQNTTLCGIRHTKKQDNNVFIILLQHNPFTKRLM